MRKKTEETRKRNDWKMEKKGVSQGNEKKKVAGGILKRMKDGRTGGRDWS